MKNKHNKAKNIEEIAEEANRGEGEFAIQEIIPRNQIDMKISLM